MSPSFTYLRAKNQGTREKIDAADVELQFVPRWFVWQLAQWWWKNVGNIGTWDLDFITLLKFHIFAPENGWKKVLSSWNGPWNQERTVQLCGGNNLIFWSRSWDVMILVTDSGCSWLRWYSTVCVFFGGEATGNYMGKQPESFWGNGFLMGPNKTLSTCAGKFCPLYFDRFQKTRRSFFFNLTFLKHQLLRDGLRKWKQDPFFHGK